VAGTWALSRDGATPTPAGVLDVAAANGLCEARRGGQQAGRRSFHDVERAPETRPTRGAGPREKTGRGTKKQAVTAHWHRLFEHAAPKDRRSTNKNQVRSRKSLSE
jgi:hypothetical protein